MRLGPSRILTCPYCKTDKKVISLLSGNTLCAEFWSDAKQITPMLREASFVQKCPSCNLYYLLTEFTQGNRYVTDFNEQTMEQGNLSFEELCSALYYLEGTIGRESETKIRIMIVQAFNDRYRKEGKIEDPSKEEKTVFHDTLSKLIETMKFSDENILFKAELYRELGDFEEAINILETITPINNSQSRVREKIIMKAKECDNIVFCLTPKRAPIDIKPPTKKNWWFRKKK